MCFCNYRLIALDCEKRLQDRSFILYSIYRILIRVQYRKSNNLKFNSEPYYISCTVDVYDGISNLSLIKKLFLKIIIVGFGDIGSWSRFTRFIRRIFRYGRLDRKSISLDGHGDRDATGDNPDILIYFIYNERTRENKEKGREKEGKEKETEIRSEVHVPQSSS